MLLKFDLPKYRERFGAQEGAYFEFPAEETLSQLQRRIPDLEAVRSTHRLLAVEQQKDIDFLYRSANALQVALKTCGAATVLLEAVITDAGDADVLFALLVRIGLGICSCSECQDLYDIADCYIDMWRWGGDSEEILLCPKRHKIFYLRWTMGVISETSKFESDCYRIGDDPLRPLPHGFYPY